MHDTVRFILAGQVEEVRNCESTRTVLEFLREDKGLTGTKEGCAEGDCGACTVVVGELHDGGIRYRAVNSCIQFLPTLDGKQLLTVEDLTVGGHARGQIQMRHTPVNSPVKVSAFESDPGPAGPDPKPFHAVQQALVDQHGSQCGFCTPGFVMSLFAMYHNEPQAHVERADIDLGLAGNLCRCTGYAPIVRAAEQALNERRQDRFTEYQQHNIEQLKSIQPTETLEVNSENGRFYAPRSITELCDLLHNHPQAVMVAGATDVGLWVSKQMRKLDTVIFLGAVAELQHIEDDGSYLHIGAAVSYTDATGPITARYPAFLPLIERIGATQVRNVGSIGGNIANGSPIGDMPPGLIAAGARLALRSTRGQRVIDLEDYFISYGKQDLQAGECLEQILLPVPPENQLFATYKISKRHEQDISAVCGAVSLLLEDGMICDARVCFGGMAEIPKRAASCEQALNGNAWNQQTIANAMHAMGEDFTPISDVRASAQYRMRVAQNLLQRFYLEHTAAPYPVRLGLDFEQDSADV